MLRWFHRWFYCSQGAHGTPTVEALMANPKPVVLLPCPVCGRPRVWKSTRGPLGLIPWEGWTDFTYERLAKMQRETPLWWVPE